MLDMAFRWSAESFRVGLRRSESGSGLKRGLVGDGSSLRVGGAGSRGRAAKPMRARMAVAAKVTRVPGPMGDMNLRKMVMNLAGGQADSRHARIGEDDASEREAHEGREVRGPAAGSGEL